MLAARPRRALRARPCSTLGRGREAEAAPLLRAPAPSAAVPAPEEPFPRPARTHWRRRGGSKPGLGSRLQAAGAFLGLRRSLAAPSSAMAAARPPRSVRGRCWAGRHRLSAPLAALPLRHGARPERRSGRLGS